MADNLIIFGDVTVEKTLNRKTELFTVKRILVTTNCGPGCSKCKEYTLDSCVARAVRHGSLKGDREEYRLRDVRKDTSKNFGTTKFGPDVHNNS